MTSQSRAVLGIALTPVLALASAAPVAAGTTAAAAASTAAPTVEKRAPGLWGARTLHAPNPNPASASGGLNALVSAGNGTLVSLTGDGLSRSTRIRPAGSTGWLAPQTWADAGGYNTELVALGDGSVRLAWRAKRADDHNNYWLKVATLKPGASAFSAPEYVAAVSEKGYHHLAAAPDGRVVAVWAVSGVLKAAEKPGPQAAWTAPSDLNTQPPSGSRDISSMDLAVAKDGTSLLVWQWQSSKAVVALEKAPAATAWTAVPGLPVPGADLARPKAFANPQGGFDVFYDNLAHLMHTRRAAGAAQWSTPRSAADHGSTSGMTAPVYLPNGDLFVAGEPGYSTAPWYALRSASTGAWQPYSQPFSTHKKVRAVRAAATSGGTVTVTWREGYSYEEYTMAAVFKGGTWSAPRRLSATSAQFAGAPQVAADALGRPVVLWDEYKRSETDSTVLTGVHQATTGSRALPKWRDHTDDGKADLFGKDSTGLKVYAGDATKLSAGQRATSWPTGTLVLPFGDLDGDGCNDVFVRQSRGEADVYPTMCGGLPDIQSLHVKVSSDWSAYDAVLSPGDLTGDGRADLLTRSAASGKLYLYAGNGSGGFKARTLAGSGYGGYKKLISAGDLDGDGKNDVLGIDASNELWRFGGTGAGTFKPRSLVFKDWGTSYKDVVGGLDLSGDGRSDLISLDKDGRAWLNRGNGQGGFANRSQVGTATNWSSIRIS
ncbi:VCBS repeat-containing protein [Streptomyces sp. PAN_FS17]|uniref:FG-GAP repeat domain-containing protein n=1 Tax=Streptomyces TaxID=1883 RepID=UPI000897EA40|nr:VCBS repeat-containing protein [Streptomyces sp. PAN_FS17]SED73238.1 Repeat domain-containing protein [Streptomyces sp. PAN_FS17]